MKNENNQQCEPCEQQFENNVDKIVNEVEGYTPSDHKARQKEVDGAFGNKTQGQNCEKGQSYGTGTKMQGQDEQWKQNTPSGEKPYGRNSGIGSASDKSYGSTADRHEHSDKEGGDAYARKTKIEGR